MFSFTVLFYTMNKPVVESPGKYIGKIDPGNLLHLEFLFFSLNESNLGVGLDENISKMMSPLVLH